MAQAHPAVIVSHPKRAAGKRWVEVLLCETQRAMRLAEPNEIILDEADGLDWATICHCDLIFAAARPDIKQFKGKVSEARRGQIVRTIIGARTAGPPSSKTSFFRVSPRIAEETS
jgi:hypothetical protein